MNKYFLLLVFLISWVSASSACSMECCKGKVKCCCHMAAPSPNTSVTPQNPTLTPPRFDVQNQTCGNIGQCNCRENIPQPLSAEQAINVPLRNPSPKQDNFVFASIPAPGRVASIGAISPHYAHLQSGYCPIATVFLRI
jgi:hypothetical protein